MGYFYREDSIGDKIMQIIINFIIAAIILLTKG